eukprot:645833-Amphidinium_carterae.1
MHAVVGRKGIPSPPACCGAKASCACQSRISEPVTVCMMSSTTICAALASTMVAWMGTARKWWVNSETAKCRAKYTNS